MRRETANRKKFVKLEGNVDTFVVRLHVSTGKRLREVADKKNMSYSAFIGEAIKRALKEEVDVLPYPLKG